MSTTASTVLAALSSEAALSDIGARETEIPVSVEGVTLALRLGRDDVYQLVRAATPAELVAGYEDAGGDSLPLAVWPAVETAKYTAIARNARAVAAAAATRALSRLTAPRSPDTTQPVVVPVPDLKSAETAPADCKPKHVVYNRATGRMMEAADASPESTSSLELILSSPSDWAWASARKTVIVCVEEDSPFTPVVFPLDLAFFAKRAVTGKIYTPANSEKVPIVMIQDGACAFNVPLASSLLSDAAKIVSDAHSAGIATPWHEAAQRHRGVATHSRMTGPDSEIEAYERALADLHHADLKWGAVWWSLAPAVENAHLLPALVQRSRGREPLAALAHVCGAVRGYRAIGSTLWSWMLRGSLPAFVPADVCVLDTRNKFDGARAKMAALSLDGAKVELTTSTLLALDGRA